MQNRLVHVLLNELIGEFFQHVQRGITDVTPVNGAVKQHTKLKNAKLFGKVPGPCRLAVIFCALTALKRDLPLLIKGGFKLDYVQGFDMFPGSQHVETLVCLTKD